MPLKRQPTFNLSPVSRLNSTPSLTLKFPLNLFPTYLTFRTPLPLAMTRDLQQHESETAPLLREHQPDPPPSGWRWSLFQARSPRAIVLLLSIAVFFISAGSTFANVPIMRILEDNICRRYYGDVLLRRDSPPPIDEKLCKIDEIQSELAYLIGLLLTLEAVIGSCTGTACLESSS